MSKNLEQIWAELIELSADNRASLFSGLYGAYEFHESNLQKLSEKIKSVKKEKDWQVKIYGKNSSEAKQENEKLKKLKNEYNRTQIAVEFFIELLEKRLKSFKET